MIRAIDEYQITGIATTLPFCRFVMEHEAFVSGNFNTKFIEDYFKPEMLNPEIDENEAKIAALLVNQLLDNQIVNNNSNNQTVITPNKTKWKERAK
jgi:propionyl-CoA carboxylase alpha chain